MGNLSSRSRVAVLTAVVLIAVATFSRLGPTARPAQFPRAARPATATTTSTPSGTNCDISPANTARAQAPDRMTPSWRAFQRMAQKNATSTLLPLYREVAQR